MPVTEREAYAAHREHDRTVLRDSLVIDSTKSCGDRGGD